ncbi:MAG: peptidoglycan DD-metalloendopeptidase family protein [Mariprofundales bacterium]
MAVLLFLLMGEGSALASSKYDAELKHNRKIQANLAKKQHRLKQSDSTLAKQTEALDRALLQANRAFVRAKKELDKVDDVLRKLEVQRFGLQTLVTQLQSQIADEAAAAWMHAGRDPSWLDMLAGVPVEEIPHRKHIIELLIASHEEKKNALKVAATSLNRVQHKTEQRRQQLARLKQEKQQSQSLLHDKRQQKSLLLRAVRRDMRSSSKRLAQLKHRAKKLEQLLAQIGTSLRSNLRTFERVSIRSQRGSLPWPMRGRLVASFGTKHPISGRLRGVQIVPRKGYPKITSIASGQVKFADWFGGFGLTMVVDYGDGVVAVYAHNDALYHQVGDWVEKGSLLANAGSTGWVEKPLLYFELRDHGKPVDPKRWCRHMRH